MQINKSVIHEATNQSPLAKDLGPCEQSYWWPGWIGSYKAGLLKTPMFGHFLNSYIYP